MEILLENLWSQVLERLQKELSRPTFETWIKTATAERLENNCLVVCTPDPLARNWLQKYYINTIADVVHDIVGHPVEIYITVAKGDEVGQFHESQVNGKLPAQSDVKQTIAPNQQSTNELNLDYVFSKFVVGANNRMAHAASLAVAESPGREFNPLFLCGGVGLGKTHLMRAIGHYRREICPDSKVFYVSTEQFTNDLITAIRQDSMQSFRQHYRAADVLLVDDIQFLEGKEYTQEEFFHTFNTLHEAGKQVVIASDRPPNQIPSLQARLCSRFSMGLIADIQPPDLETRMAILQKKAEDKKIQLSLDVIEYIAANYTSNIRELEGALTKAIAYISYCGLPMSVASLAPLLETPHQHVAATPELILKAIADFYQVSIEDLKSNSRRREISWARQIGMYLMRQHTDLSLPRIGEEFGGKDHTTVIYSCDKITQLRDSDRTLANTLRQLSDRINMNSRSSPAT
ncbi:chromosomal replication initiator protein DnaA [Calothrix sp. FACHB-1219]|uniref:chromosomal replication initiator protein DnaA n=1 Tax=unclassified Calothrix TaxID=2619626 RepID=UPI0016875809|nr:MULTISPECIES: chromosomal replication initiator protein DnaA [unclassified Calothrix]MBD2205095.1 chromosomal replication initiator protein DnaA [Calothrix sp. FACHB-168]MBD2219893.1 chromosomal replication initiator protein DnaA [Calothrix sp. FACHB-1219]